jgi:hypothetical protein
VQWIRAGPRLMDLSSPSQFRKSTRCLTCYP